MRQPRHPVLFASLLCAFLLRIALGAPCCLPIGAHPGGGHEHAHHHGQAGHTEHHAMLHGEAADDTPEDPHSEHGEDNRAKPCCSACGPTLPSSDVHFAARTAPTADFTAQSLRDLAPPAPAPAYQATGPPLRV